MCVCFNQLINISNNNNYYLLLIFFTPQQQQKQYIKKKLHMNYYTRQNKCEWGKRGGEERDERERGWVVSFFVYMIK